MVETDQTPDDEAVRPPADLSEDDPRIGITRVGAWAGSGAMRSTESIRDAVKLCKEIGIRRLDIVCNDHSDRRSPTPFDIHDAKKIVALATAATTEGIDVHLMSWLMPHRDYISAAADTLMEVGERAHAKSIQFDAEEPWTKANQPLPYDEAAALVRSKFGDTVLGVTAIGFASADKIGPLARVCDYGVPQCYATAGSGLEPGTIVQRLVLNWKHKGMNPKAFVVGLAAYHQEGIAGHTPASAIRAAFHGAEGLPAVHEVIYWSLRHIGASKAVAATIKQLAAGTLAKPTA